MEERNDIVIYQSEDGLVTMEALADPANETIWASQRAMAELFGVNTQAITRHLGIFMQKESLSNRQLVPKWNRFGRKAHASCRGNLISISCSRFADCKDTTKKREGPLFFNMGNAYLNIQNSLTALFYDIDWTDFVRFLYCRSKWKHSIVH